MLDVIEFILYKYRVQCLSTTNLQSVNKICIFIHIFFCYIIRKQLFTHFQDMGFDNKKQIYTNFYDTTMPHCIAKIVATFIWAHVDLKDSKCLKSLVDSLTFFPWCIFNCVFFFFFHVHFQLFDYNLFFSLADSLTMPHFFSWFSNKPSSVISIFSFGVLSSY